MSTRRIIKRLMNNGLEARIDVVLR